MKAIAFQHHWGENLTEEQEMAQKFGELVHEEDHSEAYEVEKALLFYNGKHYFFLEANGCSCWDGDYDGWQFTKTELLKWAKAKVKQQEYDWRKQAYEHLADWIVENIK